MLKETETEETIGFFVTFLSMVKFQLGRGRTPCPHPLGYAYAPSEENKKGTCKFSAKFLAFSNETSTVQGIVLSSSQGQGNFQELEASRPRPRTWKCVLEDFTSVKPFKKLVFGGSIWDGLRRAGTGTTKLCQSVCFINIYWYKKNWCPSLNGSKN